jgi:hypothetical protein
MIKCLNLRFWDFLIGWLFLVELYIKIQLDVKKKFNIFNNSLSYIQYIVLFFFHYETHTIAEKPTNVKSKLVWGGYKRKIRIA